MRERFSRGSRLRIVLRGGSHGCFRARLAAMVGKSGPITMPRLGPLGGRAMAVVTQSSAICVSSRQRTTLSPATSRDLHIQPSLSRNLVATSRAQGAGYTTSCAPAVLVRKPISAVCRIPTITRLKQSSVSPGLSSRFLAGPPLAGYAAEDVPPSALSPVSAQPHAHMNQRAKSLRDSTHFEKHTRDAVRFR